MSLTCDNCPDTGAKRVVILRNCFNRANKFSIKCMSLYRWLSNSWLDFLVFNLRGMMGVIPLSLNFVVFYRFHLPPFWEINGLKTD